MCSVASVNGTHLWLAVILRLLYVSIALSIIVHVTETLSIVLPIAPFDGAYFGPARFSAAISTHTFIVLATVTLRDRAFVASINGAHLRLGLLA